MKQGPEETEFVKEEGDRTDQYIFQENTKTKTGAFIIIAFLIILVLGIVISALYFSDTP